MRKVILLTAMPKESVWSSSIYVNGGGKVTFCVKHNLISTFFNFVFYCTLVFIMWLLSGGNVCAQTTLSLDNNGFNYDKNGTVIKFKDNGISGNIGRSCVGGASWAATYSSGETHTFTVNLNTYSGTDIVKKLYIAALDCEIINQYGTYTSNIVAEASIDPSTASVLTLEVKKPYVAVYLYKENNHDNWECVDIASVTRTVSSGTPSSVDISESADNSISTQTLVTVNLTRSLVKDVWNTICLPFVPTSTQANDIFGEDAKFAEFSSVSNGVMQFRSVAVGSLVAGTPYLVLPTRDDDASSPIVLTGVNITATSPTTVVIGDYSFIGIYSPTSFAEGNWPTTRFVGSDNKLLKPNTTNALKALRAYFTVPGASSAKNYTFAVDSFVPTSIDNIQIEGDGDGAIYNIGGQRVEGKSLPKGIYIREGKKFVVK